MSIKNPIQILMEAIRVPQALEGFLPSKAPKLSNTLTNIAGKLPKLPNFPVALPDLPPVPSKSGGGGGTTPTPGRTIIPITWS